MNGIDKVYIVHYAPLADRKKRLTQQLLINGITNYEFCENYNRDTTPKDVMDTYFKLDNLTPAQICITISHIEIYRDIVVNGYSRCLILEDDAILCNDFAKTLNLYTESLPGDIDMAFLNSGCNLHAQGIVSDCIWYSAKSSRTCCAYIVTRNACEKMLATIVPFVFAIDHELNRQIAIHSLKVYWCEPTIVRDGSEEYGSSYVRY